MLSSIFDPQGHTTGFAHDGPLERLTSLTDAAGHTTQFGYVAPTSAVAALPAVQNQTSFSLRWSGQDNAGGNGVAAYDIYVSTAAAPFWPWLQRTTLTTARFQGAFGHTYAFYSLARDRSGNVEKAPATPDASTRLAAP